MVSTVLTAVPLVPLKAMQSRRKFHCIQYSMAHRRDQCVGGRPPYVRPYSSTPGVQHPPKSSQNQCLTVPLHYVAPSNGFPAMPNGLPYIDLPNDQHSGLSMQQMQNLKSVLASVQMQPGQDMSNVNVNGGRLPGSFIGHPVSNGGHFNMQLGAGANVNIKLRRRGKRIGLRCLRCNTPHHLAMQLT
jgi:hypothetical protein